MNHSLLTKLNRAKTLRSSVADYLKTPEEKIKPWRTFLSEFLGSLSFIIISMIVLHHHLHRLPSSSSSSLSFIIISMIVLQEFFHS